MELTESEAALIARARQTPAERTADNAARQAAQEARMLAHMSPAERDAYHAEKAAVATLTPMQRVALQFLELKALADENLQRPDVALEVPGVQLVIDGLKPKLQTKPQQPKQKKG